MRIKNSWAAFIILLMCCMALAKIVHGDDFWVNRSTNIQGGNLVGFLLPNSRQGDMIGSIIINTRASSGTIQVFDSSGTTGITSNGLGVIQLSSGIANGRDLGGYSSQTIYNMHVSSGITISKSGFADVTFTWKSQTGR